MRRRTIPRRLRSCLAGWRGLLLALALAGFGPDAGRAEPLRLSPAELRGTALVALSNGHAAEALGMAHSLLARDPNDLLAALILARALRDLGRDDAAIEAARTAWRLAETAPERHDAAQVMAQVLASAGHDLRAALWLRRALDLSPSPQARAGTLRDLRYLKARSPLSMSGSFELAPSSNINGGSSAEEAILFGLPFRLGGASRALSGLRIGAEGHLSYRLPGATNARRDLVLADLALRTHRLTREARRQAPDVEAGDFDQIAGYLALRREWAALGAAEIGVGQSSFGGRSDLRYLRLRLERETAGPASALRFGGEFRAEDDMRGKGDSLVLGLFAGKVVSAASGGFWAAEVRANRAWAHTPAHDFAEIALALRRDFPVAPVSAETRGPRSLGAAVSLGGQLRHRRYAASPFAPGARGETGASLRTDVALTGIERYGFVPVITLEAGLRRSPVDLYDSATYGLSIGLRSVF